MKVKIKINNDAPANFNNKWIRATFLILGIIFTLLAIAHIFCMLVKPNGYKKMIFVLGEDYISQLLMGVLFLLSYKILKMSKRVKVN